MQLAFKVQCKSNKGEAFEIEVLEWDLLETQLSKGRREEPFWKWFKKERGLIKSFYDYCKRTKSCNGKTNFARRKIKAIQHYALRLGLSVSDLMPEGKYIFCVTRS